MSSFCLSYPIVLVSEVVDLESGIDRIRGVLHELSSEIEDVVQAAYYEDIPTYITDQLQEAANIFAEGEELCTLFLTGERNLESLLEAFLDLQLILFLRTIRSLLPEELRLRFFAQSEEN